MAFNDSFKPTKYYSPNIDDIHGADGYDMKGL